MAMVTSNTSPGPALPRPGGAQPRNPRFRGVRAPVRRQQAVAGCYLIRPDRTSAGFVSGATAPLRLSGMFGRPLAAFAVVPAAPFAGAGVTPPATGAGFSGARSA